MKPVVFLTLAVLFLLVRPLSTLCSGEPVGTITVGPEIVLVSDGPGRKLRSLPAVAFGNNSYLVVWQEGWHGDKGNSRIYAARVELDGRALTPNMTEIAPCKTGVQENPRVAFYNGAFLVVWQDFHNGKDCDVLGARISQEGKLLDAQLIAIGSAPRTQSMPDIAVDDKGFMVVWHGFQSEETVARIYARRVGRDGETEQIVAVTQGASPRIAWNGREHLIVYSTGHLSAAAGAAQAKSWLRMSKSGKPLSKPEMLWENPYYSLCALPEEKGWLMVCPGGPPNFWGRSVGSQRAFKINTEGKLAADTPTVSPYAPQGKTVPANWLDASWEKKGVWPWGDSTLAPAGQYCVAVWQRYQIGGATGIALSNSDLRAGRVDGWKPLDPQGGVTLADSADNEQHPALAGNSAGKLLCVYEKLLNDGNRQICARTLETR